MTPEDFGRAYQTGYQRTVRFLQKCAVDRDQAIEIAEEAWIKGLEHLPELHDENVVVGWINVIAYRLFLTGLREPRSVDHSEINYEPTVPPSVNPEVIAVRQTLARCTPRHRRLLLAFYYYGYSAHEIATHTGRSLEAIHAEMYRARQDFREHMQGTRRQVLPRKRILRMRMQKQDVVRSTKSSAA
jgi:DNA-directed RNA polymerase specialized sigma24 family protein